MFVSLINFLFPTVFLVIILLISSFVNLFKPGGRKKYKSNIILFILVSGNDSGHNIDVIISLLVILNKQMGIGLSFKSLLLFPSKFLFPSIFLLTELVKSTLCFGSQFPFVEEEHSLWIEIAQVYNLS